MVRRLAAHRIGLRGIAGDLESLAAAAAEILVALVAVAARRLHPGFAPVGVEGLAAHPDIGQRLVLHARQLQARQVARVVAGQGHAIRRNRQKHRTPAIHAGLRTLLEVIGNDKQNPAARAELGAVALHHGLGFNQLCVRRHQVVAVGPGPAVILRVGQFQEFGIKGQRHLDDLVHMRQIVPVQHAVEHHRPVVLLDQARHALLEFKRFGMAQEIVEFAGRVLERQLHMVQSGVFQPAGAGFGQADARSDQVGIKAQVPGFLHQLFKVVPEQWLAA